MKFFYSNKSFIRKIIFIVLILIIIILLVMTRFGSKKMRAFIRGENLPEIEMMQGM
jgi:hypothetical protein